MNPILKFIQENQNKNHGASYSKIFNHFRKLKGFDSLHIDEFKQRLNFELNKLVEEFKLNKYSNPTSSNIYKLINK